MTVIVTERVALWLTPHTRWISWQSASSWY